MQQRVAPRGEQGKVEMRDRAETVGNHEQVARVATEREGRARGSLQREELPAN